MPFPRRINKTGPAILELVLCAVGLPVIALRAHAELVAAAAAEAKPTDRIFDVTMATEGLRDRRAGADSCRVR